MPIPTIKQPIKKTPKEKPPVIKYRYKLVTVATSQEAGQMEKALRERMGEFGMSFFAMCHDGGAYDIMGDSGTSKLDDATVKKARALAAEIKKG